MNSWVLAALAIVGAQAVEAPLTQGDLVRQLGISQGRWITHVTIESIDAKPLEGSKPLPQQMVERIKLAIGRENDTEDCVTERVADPRKIILPGLTMEGWVHASWSANGGKLTIGAQNASGGRIQVASTYSSKSMHSEVTADVRNSVANIHLRTRLDSRFAGRCAAS